MRVHVHNHTDMILCATRYKRPPVLGGRFCWAGGAVAQDRFYCTNKRMVLKYYFDDIYQGEESKNNGCVVRKTSEPAQ